jgi:hypothetical protein
MAGFNAGQYSTGERGYSDVESVQAPVVENKVVEGAALLDGINSAVNVGASIATTYKANARAEALATEKEAKKSFSNQYDTSIRKYAGLVASGAMTQAQSNVYLQKDKDSLLTQGASADDLTSTELQTVKTLAGRALIEGSQEEQAQKIFDESYNKSSYWTPNQTPIQRQIGMANMKRDEQDAQSRATNMSKLALEAAQFEKGSNEYKAKQQEIKGEQMDYVNKLLAQTPVNASNEQQRLVAEYTANLQEMPESEARVLLENKWKGFVRTSTRTADQFAAKVEGGLPVQRKAYVDSLTAISDSFLESLGDGQVVAMDEKLLKESQGKLKVVMMNSSEDANKLQVVTDTFGPQAAVYFQGLTGKVATDFNDFNVDAMTRKDGDPAPSFGRNKETIEAARDTLSLNINDFLDGKHKGDPKNLEKLFSGHIARVSEDFKTMTTKEIDKSIAFLATPEVGRFIKMRGLSNADLDNVNRQMFTYKGRVADNFLSLVKDTLNADDKRESLLRTNPRLAMAAARVPEYEDFDVVFEGGQVMVRAKAERGRKQAEELNNKITGPLTRIVKVDSNLSGKSQESIFNSWKEQLWPDPSKQEQAPATKEVAPAVDYSQYEGRQGVDEQGSTFVVRNGIPVKVGGADGK